MNANSLLEAPSFRVGRPQFTWLLVLVMGCWRYDSHKKGEIIVGWLLIRSGTGLAQRTREAYTVLEGSERWGYCKDAGDTTSRTANT